MLIKNVRPHLSPKYATLGAGPIDGKLRSGINRKKDIMINIKKELIATGVSDSDVIDDLFLSEKNFRNDTSVDYEWFPLGFTNGYNSNSFTSGLLNSTRVILPNKPTYSVPGWDKPLPNRYFE